MKKEQIVGTRIPEETRAGLGDNRESGAVRPLHDAPEAALEGDWKLEHYARLYGEGKISLARAAAQTGVSL